MSTEDARDNLISACKGFRNAMDLRTLNTLMRALDALEDAMEDEAMARRLVRTVLVGLLVQNDG